MRTFITISIILLSAATAVHDELETNSLNGAYLHKLLTSDRTDWEEFPLRYIPIPELIQNVWTQTQLSKSELYDSRSKYPPKHAFNHLISIPDIELIINENDKLATKEWIDGFHEQFSPKMAVSDRFYKLQLALGGKNLTLQERKTYDIDINGFDTVYYHARRGGTRSTGINSEYFVIEPSCIQLKGCNVYPIFRVLHKSKSLPNGASFSCNDIMTQLLPQIYSCFDEYGEKCPLRITHGYYRDVFKVKVPNTNKYVALKMQRALKVDDFARDLQRNVRESIFLYYLQQEEIEYIERYGAIFESGGEKRAFPFVRELGHCVYPTYIQVTPYYNMTLDYFIKSGQAASQSLKSLVAIALEIAKGTEAMHNMRGGPFHHTDVGIDQYMMDEYGHVLINDFNRGKFQYYKFADDFRANDGVKEVTKCNYCPYEADGRNRAPEELVCEPLDASVDVYSTALTIWSLFSGTQTWTEVYEGEKNTYEDIMTSGESLSYEDIAFLVHDTIRRPKMTYNIPYALKEVIRFALMHDPQKRPTATQFRKGIQDIYDNLDRYTRHRANAISKDAIQYKLFRDHHYPKVPKNFPKCCTNKRKKKLI